MLYREGQLDDRKITIDVPGSRVSVTGLDGPSNQALQVHKDNHIAILVLCVTIIY